MRDLISAKMEEIEVLKQEEVSILVLVDEGFNLKEESNMDKKTIDCINPCFSG